MGACYTETVRIAPVRETIVQQPSSIDWGTPFRAVGSVVSAPFVALGNALSPRYVEPVGERLITYPRVSYYHPRVTSYSRSTLMPVGERFTTVRVIRNGTMLEPVGERFVTLKHHKTMLKPIGERTTMKRHHHKKMMLKPVGERIITTTYIKRTPVLEPVGERTIIRTAPVYSQPWWSCD